MILINPGREGLNSRGSGGNRRFQLRSLRFCAASRWRCSSWAWALRPRRPVRFCPAKCPSLSQRGLEAQQRGHQGDTQQLNGTCKRQWLALPVLGWQLGGEPDGGRGAIYNQHTRARQPRADSSGCSGALWQLAHTLTLCADPPPPPPGLPIHHPPLPPFAHDVPHCWQSPSRSIWSSP